MLRGQSNFGEPPQGEVPRRPPARSTRTCPSSFLVTRIGACLSLHQFPPSATSASKDGTKSEGECCTCKPRLEVEAKHFNPNRRSECRRGGRRPAGASFCRPDFSLPGRGRPAPGARGKRSVKPGRLCRARCLRGERGANAPLQAEPPTPRGPPATLRHRTDMVIHFRASVKH